MSYTSLIGVHREREGKPLFERWYDIHKNAISFEQLMRERDAATASLIDQGSQGQFEKLAEVDAGIWNSLCLGLGMTVYGAIALSWCKDAELQQVWEGWLTSGFPLKPLPEYERPARFINPALMPQTNKLTGMLEAFNDKYPDSQTTYSLAICAAIASLKEPLDFDLSTDSLTKATPQIASFLKSRMLHKPDRTAEENALIEVWTKTVKGTEFNVWEGA